MRKQGSLKGVGTHRGNLFAYVNFNKICQPVFKTYTKKIWGTHRGNLFAYVNLNKI